MTTHVQEMTTVNGINVQALRQAIAGIEADPDAGQTRWKVTSRVKGISTGPVLDRRLKNARRARVRSVCQREWALAGDEFAVFSPRCERFRLGSQCLALFGGKLETSDRIAVAALENVEAVQRLLRIGSDLVKVCHCVTYASIICVSAGYCSTVRGFAGL